MWVVWSSTATNFTPSDSVPQGYSFIRRSQTWATHSRFVSPCIYVYWRSPFLFLLFFPTCHVILQARLPVVLWDCQPTKWSHMLPLWQLWLDLWNFKEKEQSQIWNAQQSSFLYARRSGNNYLSRGRWSPPLHLTNKCLHIFCIRSHLLLFPSQGQAQFDTRQQKIGPSKVPLRYTWFCSEKGQARHWYL